MVEWIARLLTDNRRRRFESPHSQEVFTNYIPSLKAANIYMYIYIYTHTHIVNIITREFMRFLKKYLEIKSFYLFFYTRN